ncbi:MAG: hypothetical protein K8S20_08255 [Chloroflexi bacterium]|nr:hypothetical protein [Chloroflexota bacterium]
MMNPSNLMQDMLIDLEEEKQAHPASTLPVADSPMLKIVLRDASPLPREALFLGMAQDGWPVLLNLNDPIPGPILIAGDQSSGKTKLLQMIARAAELLHSAEEIQYGVITSKPEEWSGFPENQINMGLYLPQHDNTREFLQSLTDWAHNNKGGEQSIVLFMDGLDVVKDIDPQTEQNLRWLLLRGPSRRIWPIFTIDVDQARNMESWLTFFRTRLFGHIQLTTDSAFIAGQVDETLRNLTAGSQFAMREGNKWLKFQSALIE